MALTERTVEDIRAVAEYVRRSTDAPTDVLLAASRLLGWMDGKQRIIETAAWPDPAFEASRQFAESHQHRYGVRP